MSLDAKAIGMRIMHLRTAKGLSQRALADAIKADKGLISRWETGNKTPSLRSRVKLADYFKVSIEFISCNGSERVAELRERALGQSKKVLEDEKSSAAQRQMAAKVAWLPTADAEKSADAREDALQQLMRDAGEEFLRKLARLRLDES
jgi:transcriptional regulator with XRE-family HTH domain